MMNDEELLTHFSVRFFQWAAAAVEPAENASDFAKEAMAKVLEDKQLSEMAETAVDGLMQAGYAPHEAAIAIARGAHLTIAEMIRYYAQFRQEN